MQQLTSAKIILQEGGIIIFPTDTVFGIGCLVNFPKSIEKLYQIKKRDGAKPTLVLASSVEKLEKLAVFNARAKQLADAFWPGPLTICLQSRKSVPKSILGPQNTLAVRVPAHKWLLNLLKQVGAPLLAPSANFQGGKPAKFLAEIDKELIKLVDYVVDIEPEGLRPSTIISFENNKNYKLVRAGPISKEEIDQVFSKT